MIFYGNFRSNFYGLCVGGEEIADSKWIIESIKFKARCFPMAYAFYSLRNLALLYDDIKQHKSISVNAFLGLVHECYEK